MKRIIIFKGGLGNQMFQYGMYTYQRHVMHRQVAYMYRENAHNGFELETFFHTDLNKATTTEKMFYWIAWRLYKYGICRRFVKYKTDDTDSQHAFFFNGHWQDRKYILHEGFNLSFKAIHLSQKNQAVAKAMAKGSSVAVHIRRGDYLLPQNRKVFVLLGPDYYQQAIALCNQRVPQPVRYFFFSDDIGWAKENIAVENAAYIDWNTGSDSIYDMYLMTLTSANIIANSTFSFWGAFLNKKSLLTIYPEQWFVKGVSPNIFPDHWVAKSNSHEEE